MTIDCDVVIIGAGPTGLFQVFELGLLGIKAHLVETMDRPGGQCTELYPDKPIYDIPALPAIGAQQMVDNLLEQIKPFDPRFHFNQQVLSLQQLADKRFHLTTTAGTVFNARAVVIAAGVGSLDPVRLKLAGVTELENSQIFYSVKDVEQHRGRELVILGGGDSALDWALELQGKAESLTLIHRSDRFKAAPESVRRMKELDQQFLLQHITGNVTELVTSNDNNGEPMLSALAVTGGDGVTRRVDVEHLLVFFGLAPKPGPILDWKLEMRKKQIVVDTEKFQTSIDGIFAIGDVNWYPGKKKLILSGFHEAALAAFAIKSYLEPDSKVSLQYTTTSSKMHQRLGVEDPYAEGEVAA